MLKTTYLKVRAQVKMEEPQSEEPHQAETCRHLRKWCICRRQTERPTFPKQTYAGVAEEREEEIL